MLTTLRILRGIVGFIAIWQVIGLLPIFTNWLPNLSSTTGNMWAIAILKLLVLAISGAAYYWLGRIKTRYENADARTSELPAIGIALGAVVALGVTAAIVIPNIAKDADHTSAPAAPGEVNIEQPVTSAPPQAPEQQSATPSTMKECLDMFATTASSVGNMEILTGFCTTAFDPAAHPVDRARSLCQVKGWTVNPNIPPGDVSTRCYTDNPLPPCPGNQKFELHNKRCEVTCSGLDGYAPDASGQQCVHVCPAGTMAVYAGYATECMRLQ